MDSRDRTVAYHVGAHKTGTSLVQKFMHDRKRLLWRHRMRYVERPEMNEMMGASARAFETPDDLAAHLRAQFDSRWISTAVVSYEKTLGRPFYERSDGLYPRADKTLTLLAKALAPYRSRIVLCIRPQVEFIESYYLQTLQQGDHVPFDRWFARWDMESMSWRPIIARLHEIFGVEQVHVVDFRLIRTSQQRFLEQFFAAVDPAVQLDFTYDAVRNPSLSEQGMNIALAANPYLTDLRERRAMRRFLQTNFSNRDQPRARLLTDVQREWLRERYDAEFDDLTSSDIAG